MKVILGFALVLGSVSAFSATQGDITISGTVAPELSLSLSTSSYSNLDIVNGGDHTVATATEVCNDLDGYKVYGYSANGSQLENQDNTDVQTSYTLKYGGASAVTLGSSDANKVELKDSGALSASVSHDSSVVVDVNAFSNAPAGVYQDVVTLQIVAN